MARTLCLDFGNTRLKAAVFADERIETVVTLGEPSEQLPALLQQYRPQRSILSSVVNHDPALETLLQKETQFHRLTNLSKLPFTIPVGKPETMGTDRLALAAAAVHFFPKKNNLAIALGSCITYNFINQQHEMMGGSISPGLEMRFRAMHQFTAKLPMVQPSWNVPLIGYDTETNLQSGVVLGMATEVDGIIELYENRFGNFNVLLTGGDIAYFGPHLKNKIFADPDLIFKGLYAISQSNAS